MTKAPLGQEQTGPNPTDRAKRGVKRSLLVEGHGLPIGLAIEGANRNDFKMTQRTLESIPITRSEPTKSNGRIFAWIKGMTTTKSGNWWMNRCRAILIRRDKKVENYLSLLHLACAFITSGLLG
jgi:putative transposase